MEASRFGFAPENPPPTVTLLPCSRGRSKFNQLLLTAPIKKSSPSMTFTDGGIGLSQIAPTPGECQPKTTPARLLFDCCLQREWSLLPKSRVHSKWKWTVKNYNVGSRWQTGQHHHNSVTISSIESVTLFAEGKFSEKAPGRSY